MIYHIGNILSYDNLHSRHIVGLRNFWYQIFCFTKNQLYIRNGLTEIFIFYTHPPYYLLYMDENRIGYEALLVHWKGGKTSGNAKNFVKKSFPRWICICLGWQVLQNDDLRPREGCSKVIPHEIGFRARPKTSKYSHMMIHIGNILSYDDSHREYPLLWWFT